MRRAFTLIELLVVIGILALLAAILFPVFAQVRAKGRETVCVSNLKQIGLAFHAYAQDFDDRLPWGGDPLDLRPGGWAGSEFEEQAKTLAPLPNVLDPYTKSKQIWHCPADSGFERGGRGESTPLDTRPSSFEKFGISYYFDTQIALKQLPLSNLQAWEWTTPHKERGPSQIILLYDGTGSWHGGRNPLLNGRYACLYADGHARVLNRAPFEQAFTITWTKPGN